MIHVSQLFRCVVVSLRHAAYTQDHVSHGCLHETSETDRIDAAGT